MPYAATVVNVMLASPSDVVAERAIARDVVDEWNVGNAERTGSVLLAIGWDTHSAPEMGDRPQAIINRQVLAKADLLVAIFHNRLGTPTGEAESGTAEEITRHVEAGKPTMLYFSDVPTRPSEVDKGQRERVDAFRKAMEPHGIIGSFDDRDDFERVLRRHLDDRVHEQFGGSMRAREAVMRPALPTLTSVASSLLVYASEGDGYLLVHVDESAFAVSAGGKTYGGDTPRERAFCERAIDELERSAMVERVGKRDPVYRVTAEGYEEVDRLVGSGFKATLPWVAGVT